MKPNRPMSPEMVRLLRWMIQHGYTMEDLQQADQRRLKGLAVREYVSKRAVTPAGIEAASQYTHAEFIGRKAGDKEISDGVSAALALVRMRAKGKGA